MKRKILPVAIGSLLLLASLGSRAVAQQAGEQRSGSAELQRQAAGRVLTFYTGEDEAHGVELWRSDGTSRGTFLVFDVRPGPDSSQIGSLVDLDGVVYFTADDGVHGRELWRSDGTAAGTGLVVDLARGSASSVSSDVVVMHNALYLVAEDRSGRTRLWRSDGTALGTTAVKSLESLAGPLAIRSAGGLLFLSGADRQSGWAQIWRSDGTETGTQLVDMLPAERAPARLEEVVREASGDLAAPLAADGIWRGSTSQGASHIYELIVSNNKITQSKFGGRNSTGSCSFTTTFLSLSVPIVDESFSLSFSGCPTYSTNGTFGAQTASGALSYSWSGCSFGCPGASASGLSWNATLNPPEISINDVAVAEGDAGTTNATFNVTLSGTSGQTISVNYTTVDGTGGSGAIAGIDYQAVSGTLNFAPGTTSQPINVPILGDTLDEPNKTFTIALSAPTNATILDGTGLGTINDNDPTPAISVYDRTVAEGNAVNASFVVVLANGSAQNVTVAFATSDGTATGSGATSFNGGAVAIVDTPGANTSNPSKANPYPSTINVASSSGTVQKVTLKLNGFSHSYPTDAALLLVGPTGKSVILMAYVGGFSGVSNANVTFDDSAAAPVGSSGPTSGSYQPGGGSSSNPVFPSPAPASPYGTQLSVFNGDNPAGDWKLFIVDRFNGFSGSLASWQLTLETSGIADYVATSGTLTFTPGRVSHAVFVPITADGVAEGTETFTFTLSNPTNATIADATAIGTIQDPPASADIPMYRAYNPNAFYHFFTTSLGEFNNAVAAGYRDESNPPCCSIPFRVPNLQGAGKAAIFRMYNPNNGRHYYTANSGERDILMGLGWVYEKDEGFIHASMGPGTVEVFKLYNNISGVHLYTVRPEEKDAILAQFPGIWFQHTSLGFAVP